MNLSRRIWTVFISVMVLVIGLSTAMIRDARAGASCLYFTNTAPNTPCNPGGVAPSFRAKYEYQFAGCTFHSILTKFRYGFGNPACPPDLAAYVFARDCPVVDPTTQNVLDHVIMSASVPVGGFPDVAAIVVGDAIAGHSQLSTSAVGDTVSANVHMRVNVVRSGSNMTLSNFTGLLSVTNGRAARVRPARARFVLAVYPDSNAALAANTNDRGTALFWGRVDLARDRTGKKLTLSGDFGGADFTSPADTDTLTSTAGPGSISKVVALGGATEPVALLLADPMAGADAVPAVNTAGILALSAAMAGAGLWVMARRRRSMA